MDTKWWTRLPSQHLGQPPPIPIHPLDSERRELDGKDNGGLLGDEEKGELERRRAAELEGRQVVSPVEAGWRGERAELEARREAGRYEIG